MKTAILLFAPVITLSLVGCQQTSDDYPRDLQAKLAHLLDEQTQRIRHLDRRAGIGQGGWPGWRSAHSCRML